jgi:membrane fusion protein (multidrug efflux system)
VPNPDGILLPGSYVRAILEEGIDDNAILVPQKAVSRDSAGGASALVLNDAGKVEQRTLTVARVVGNNWWVTAGLKAGDKVIIDGLQKVSPGDSPNGVDMTASATANKTAPASTPAAK